MHVDKYGRHLARLRRRTYADACGTFAADEDAHTKMKHGFYRYGAPHGGPRPPSSTITWYSPINIDIQNCHVLLSVSLHWTAPGLFHSRTEPKYGSWHTSFLLKILLIMRPTLKGQHGRSRVVYTVYIHCIRNIKWVIAKANRIVRYEDEMFICNKR